MDQVLANVASKESFLSKFPLDEHVEPLIRTALFSVNYYKPGMQRLLIEVPHALSSNVMDTMENKTLTSIKNLFPKHFDSRVGDDVETKLRILIRVITGYFIQAILNDQRELDTEEESSELASMVSLYLQHNNMY